MLLRHVQNKHDIKNVLASSWRFVGEGGGLCYLYKDSEQANPTNLMTYWKIRWRHKLPDTKDNVQYWVMEAHLHGGVKSVQKTRQQK